MKRFDDDGPLTLTRDEAAFVLAWLEDQRETWANVGSRAMLSAVETLIEQVTENQ